MKSEERHELKQNELERLIERARPYVEAHGNTILLVVLGVVLVFGGFIYWSRSTKDRGAAGWTEYRAATTAEDFTNVAEKFPGSVVGAWALCDAGETHLRSAVQFVFTNRASGIDDLKQAREAFEGVLQNAAAPAEARERAAFGLARTLETMAGTQAEEKVTVKTAIEQYERFANEFPESVYKELADRRVEHLTQESAVDFYAWFRTEDPKPEDIRTPNDGSMGGLPPGHPELGGGPPTLPEIPPELRLPDAVEAPESTGDPGPSLPGPAIPDTDGDSPESSDDTRDSDGDASSS